MNFKKIFRFKRKEIFGDTIPNNFYEEIFKIINNPGMLSDKDFIYFDTIRCYGTSKHHVVEEIMMSEQFGITPMHVELNKIYFQKEEKSHLKNKRTTLKSLDFLSKRNLHAEDGFIRDLIFRLFDLIPKNQEINLVDYFTRPLVFIKTLNDFELLGFLNEFNPSDPDFEYNQCVKSINEIFNDQDKLKHLIELHLEQNDDLPKTMQHIMADAESSIPFESSYISKFITSMLFAGFESTASFITSLTYFYLKHYKDLLLDEENKNLTGLMNEIVRIYVPTQIAFRTVKEDCKFRGNKFKKGDLIILFLRFANLDSEVFESPDDIVLDRTEQHLSFGKGRIACIGKYSVFSLGSNLVKSLSSHPFQIEILPEPIVFIDLGMRRIENISTVIHEISESH